MARQYGQRPSQPGKEDRRKDQEPDTKKQDPSPSADVVRQFHQNASVDTRGEDIHHTLGREPHQASPGGHVHDGGSSRLLLEGFVIVGVKATPATVLPSLISCLVRLGATDSTT